MPKPLAPCLLAAAIVLGGPSALVGQSSSSQLLVPGQAVERQIEGDEVHLYELPVAAGEALVVVASQRGADVVLSATPVEGDEIAVSRPSGGRGPVTLLLEPPVSGTVELAVSRRDSRQGPGGYRLSLEALDPRPPAAAERLTVARHLTAAGRLYRAGEVQRRPALAAELVRAVELLESGGDERALAWATDFQAAVFRLQDQASAAADAYRRGASLWRRLGETALEARALLEQGWFDLRRDPSLELAPSAFERALELARGLGDVDLEARARNHGCTVSLARHRWDEAAACYRDALPVARAGSDRALEVSCLLNLGQAHQHLGELDLSLAFYEQALEVTEGTDQAFSEATALNNLGLLYGRLSETDEALGAFGRALDTFRRGGFRSWEARTLYNLGDLYLQIGEHDLARSSLDEALELYRQTGYGRGESTTLLQRARVDALDGRRAAALRGVRRVLDLCRDLGDERLEAFALLLLAELQADGDDTAAALESSRRSIDTFRRLSDRRGLAQALRVAADSHPQRSASRRELLTEALGLAVELRDRPLEIAVSTAFARAELALDRPGEALEYAERAVELVESMRLGMSSPDLRATFRGSRQGAYEQAIEARMALHRRAPGEGHALAALEISERARSRSLLDLLREARAFPTQEVDPELIERRRLLALRLQGKAALQVELLSGGSSGPSHVEALERQVDAILRELDGVEAQIHRQSPRRARLEAADTLDAGAIRSLLDDDTLVLEYALGEQRSYLWAITHRRVSCYQLPGREALESLARRVYESLAELSVGSQTATTDRQELSRLLLGPVVELADARRLVVVADGALGYVPFIALTGPGSEAPLLVTHEVVALPSASVLSLLRERRFPRPSAASRVAVLADPVFDTADPRLTPAGGETTATESVLRGPGLELERLPASRREAETIAELLPADSLHVALGFEASRRHVLDTDWRPYRWLHFATHGLIHTGRPALSGLVLSLVAKDGRPQDGFLSLEDVYNLELASDLVVLSGCETALGREVRGEGLVGLTQGFFQAGANGLAVSLWRVGDRATAELMERFYRALLTDGLPPAAALAQAQRSIAGERRWRDPYYWASFVYQGEWVEGTTRGVGATSSR
jgi:CHAT domain-containing protein/Tfp pilus assembly protein PilF